MWYGVWYMVFFYMHFLHRGWTYIYMYAHIFGCMELNELSSVAVCGTYMIMYAYEVVLRRVCLGVPVCAPPTVRCALVRE